MRPEASRRVLVFPLKLLTFFGVCGISGIVDTGGKRVEFAELSRMSSRLRHRGGDAEGIALIHAPTGEVSLIAGEGLRGVRLRGAPSPTPAVIANVGFAHHRFSIVDLSDAADQPFVSSDGSVCVAFNGEIYNHVELRQELRTLGCRFRTKSDTEVLVEAFRTWGTDCFTRFNGFWATAIFDRRRGRVILSRDRVGKKSLYWSRHGSRIYFASEIKALLAVDHIWSHRKVNEAKAFEWLAHGLRDVDCETMFEGIFKFPAAHWAVLDASFPLNVCRFWRLPEQRLSERALSASDAASELRRLVVNSVQLRQQADVPSCLELSGGLDSSVIAAAAAGCDLRAFTVSFPEFEHSETAYAKSAAEHLNIKQRILEKWDESVWPNIRAFVDLHEEPFHSPNLRANQGIWQAMRTDGFRVSLNGAAGDELFGGYGHYFPGSQFDNLRNLRLASFTRNAWRYSEARSPLRGLAASVLELAPGLRHLRRSAASPLAAIAVSARAGSTGGYAMRGVGLDAILRHDFEVSKIPYWMASGDKNFMGIPIEVRMPFLDFRLVDFAFAMPTTYLIRDGWHKWILRMAFRGLLPENVLWRRKKLGFPFPMSRFLRESSSVIDLILSQSDNPFIDAGKSKLFRDDWRFLSFILWYEHFFNGNDRLFDAIEAKSVDGAKTGYQPMFLAGLT